MPPLLEAHAEVGERHPVRVQPLAVGSIDGHVLRCEVEDLPKLLLLFLELSLRLLAFVDIGQHRVPPNDPAASVVRRSPPHTKPAVHAVVAAKAVVDLERMAALHGLHPPSTRGIAIIRVNRLAGPTVFQLLSGLAEIFEDLLVDELE